MKREPTPTAGELAEGLRRLCPGREGDFVTALRWLYDHPREAAALCGLEEALSQGELLSALRQGTGRNSWPWRPGGWWRKGKIAQEKTRDNRTITREYESLRRLNKKDAPKVLTGQNPCGIMGKLPKPGDSFC